MAKGPPLPLLPLVALGRREIFQDRAGAGAGEIKGRGKSQAQRVSRAAAKWGGKEGFPFKLVLVACPAIASFIPGAGVIF